MNPIRALALPVVAALLLAGCITAPPRAPVAVDPVAAGQADAQRAALPAWDLAGRVAISGPGRGGSGRLDWEQRGDRYDLTLSAPITRQGWRLSGDAGSARLEGIEGGPREGADVEALLYEATGWEIPVRALVDWVRGVAAPETLHGPARVAHGEGDVPARIDQAGWTIEYDAWFEAGIGQPALPRRIEATRADARVRLVVDAWTVLPGEPRAQEASSPAAQLERELAALRLDDPAADMREHVAAGDLRPLGVCGFACLAPRWAPGGGAAHGVPMRIIDGTGDVVRGDGHLALKHRAQAYAAAYNQALAEWLRRNPAAADTGD